MLRTAGERLLYVWGPQTEKARLPKWVLVRFTTAALVSDDLSWRRCEAATLNSTRSMIHDGQWLWRIWCISVAVLYKHLLCKSSAVNNWISSNHQSNILTYPTFLSTSNVPSFPDSILQMPDWVAWDRHRHTCSRV